MSSLSPEHSGGFVLSDEEALAFKKWKQAQQQQHPLAGLQQGGGRSEGVAEADADVVPAFLARRDDHQGTQLPSATFPPLTNAAAASQQHMAPPQPSRAVNEWVSDVVLSVPTQAERSSTRSPLLGGDGSLDRPLLLRSEDRAWEAEAWGKQRSASYVGAPSEALFRGASASPSEPVKWFQNRRDLLPVVVTVVGVLSFIFIVVIIFGAVQLGNYSREKDRFAPYEPWSNATTCRVMAWQKVGVNCTRPADTSRCCYYTSVTVRVSGWGGQQVTAFSNFEQGRCGGQLNWTVGSEVPCWIVPEPSTDRRVLLNRPTPPDSDDERSGTDHLIAGGVLLGITWLVGILLAASLFG